MLTNTEAKSLLGKERIKCTYSKKNIKTKQLSSRLDFKKLGLYKIVTKKLLVNYKLRLLKGLRLYLVFYILLLKLALLEIAVSNDEIELKHKLDVYDVKKILDSRVSKKGIKYLVK
jgi:hypothetical protein